MTLDHESVIVRTCVRLIAPLVQLYGFYVIFHGHYSPGGGFQGGVIIASSYVLIGMGLGRAALARLVSERTLVVLGGLGVLVYVAVGALSWLGGAVFLDYGALAFLSEAVPMRRFLGILLVELGVALTVGSVMVFLYLRLSEPDEPAASADGTPLAAVSGAPARES